MKKDSWTLLILGIGVTVAILMSRAKASQPDILPSPPPSVVCAADVRQCPDGSWVGRKPPSCEFAECPPYIPVPLPPPPVIDSPPTVDERLIAFYNATIPACGSRIEYIHATIEAKLNEFGYTGDVGEKELHLRRIYTNVLCT